MIRNLKTLGLTLVAVFAISAMAASAASAQIPGVLTADGPFTLHGENESPPAVNALTAFSLSTGCTISTYTGEGVGGGDLASGSTTFTVTPTFSGCTGSGFPVTYTFNGCHFVVHLGETIESDLYKVTMDLVCPVGKSVEIHLYLSKAAHEKNESFCTVTIGAQINLAGARLRDETNGHLTLGGALTGITVTRDLGPCGPEATTNTGTFDLAVTITGRNSTGGATAVSISEK